MKISYNIGTKTIRVCYIYILICGILSFKNTINLYSQTDTLEWKFYGNASVSSDLYFIDQDPDSTNRINARRPANLHRLLFSSNLAYGIFELPVSIMISSNQTNFTVQSPNEQTLMQYLQNPMNIIRITPKIGDISLQFGSYLPRYSDLSTGNSNLFGLGAEYRSEKLAISLFYGISQRAINQDTLRGIIGAFERRSLTARIHYGKRETGLIGINFVTAEDIESSINSISQDIYPEKGLLTTFNFIIPIIKNIFIEGELGGSIFTRNINAEDVDYKEVDFLKSITTINSSSRIDGAGKFILGIDYSNWGITFNTLYIGDGYVPLGYRFFQSDRMEFSVSPKIRLFEGRFFANASIGTRVNNISNTKAQTSDQMLLSINALANITDYFNINASFSNFGFRNRTDNDTLKVDMISSSLNLTPNLILRSDELLHSITLNLALDNFKDYNTLTMVTNENLTASLTGVYVLSFMKIPLSLNFITMHLRNDIKPFAIRLFTSILGIGYRFLNNKLIPSLSISYNNTNYTSAGTDHSIGFRTKINYQMNENINFAMELSTNQYNYGELRNNAFFGETFLRLIASTKF